jgi:hypothetical protein
VEQKHYIGDFAVVTTTGAVGQYGEPIRVTHYLHRDHLGSVDAVTNASGMVIDRMSFDAWGKRRTATWTAMSDIMIGAFDSTTVSTRGSLIWLCAATRSRGPRDDRQ